MNPTQGVKEKGMEPPIKSDGRRWDLKGFGIPGVIGVHRTLSAVN
jgi:hypothetical protein